MSTPPAGPVMLAVTNVLRPPPTRVGKLSDNIVLPRTVELRKLVAGGAGTFAGMLLWMFPVGLPFGYSFMSLFACAAVGAFLGVGAVSWSPIRGESLLTWLGLSSSTLRADRVRINGRRVRAYICVAPLAYTAAGPVRVRTGAIDVPAGSVDERGVPFTQQEMLRRLQVRSPFDAASLELDGFSTPKRLPR